MKITSFNPQIVTKDAEPIVSLFEALGFEKQHTPEGIGELNVKGIRMKDANGFHLDISTPELDLPRDITVIRINVDDFDEAYAFFTSRGFKNFYGDKTVDRQSSRSAILFSPSGLAVNLIQHIKE